MQVSYQGQTMAEILYLFHLLPQPLSWQYLSGNQQFLIMLAIGMLLGINFIQFIVVSWAPLRQTCPQIISHVCNILDMHFAGYKN